MDTKKIIIGCLVQFVFLLLFSCGSREVLKNTSLQESKKEDLIKETEKKSDTSVANIQKLSENMSFELEPINDKLAHFVYIVGKDTIRVETSGKLRLNSVKNKENNTIKSASNSLIQKDIKKSEETKAKVKETNTKRVNNSFQFILIGMGLLLALQFLLKFIKEKYFI